MNWFRAIQLGAFLGMALYAFMEHRNAIGWAKAYTAAVAAGAAAEQKQIAAGLAQEARWATKASEADHDYQTALARADGISAAYARTHPVRLCAGAGAVSRADPVPQASGAATVAGPGENAELVAVTADDVGICTENSVRLQAAREWAAGL